MHDDHEPDAPRWARRSRELRDRWAGRHPAAAQELQRGFHSRAEIQDWTARYPQAAAEDIRVAMFGPGLIRSRRMLEPDWEPPEEWADGL